MLTCVHSSHVYMLTSKQTHRQEKERISIETRKEGKEFSVQVMCFYMWKTLNAPKQNKLPKAQNMRNKFLMKFQDTKLINTNERARDIAKRWSACSEYVKAWVMVPETHTHYQKHMHTHTHTHAHMKKREGGSREGGKEGRKEGREGGRKEGRKETRTNYGGTSSPQIS